MNLRVSPRRRWLWLGTWKGEALRLWGLSRRGWGGRGRSLTSSRTRAYRNIIFPSVDAILHAPRRVHATSFGLSFRRRPRPNGAGEHRAG